MSDLLPKVVWTLPKSEAIKFPKPVISVNDSWKKPQERGAAKKTLYEKAALPEIGVNSQGRRNAHFQEVPGALPDAVDQLGQPVRGRRNDI
jgi:hypothetical protein